MATDVDRNDKSRICAAGSVRVIERQPIEIYSGLIQHLDRITGLLRPEFDAVDAFLTHMWGATVTGAPKLWAVNFIECCEKTPRRWYGGAVGWFGFDGHLNTALGLRTVRLEQGIAEVRVGANLSYATDPQAQLAELKTKAADMLALLQPSIAPLKANSLFSQQGLNKKVLLIDHQDSFVHILANYLRQTSAEVHTVRFDLALEYQQQHDYDLVVLSPGPGRPKDFNLAQTLKVLIAREIPIFGVCLGLQAIVEYFGGDLAGLDYPVHGQSSWIKVLKAEPLFIGLSQPFKAGCYHSIHAPLDKIPQPLEVTAVSDEGIVMAIAHQSLPIHAVQFHPEILLSLPHQTGLKIIRNLMDEVHHFWTHKPQ